MSLLGESLSEREDDVLRCVGQGMSNREIADHLIISPNTVKVHLRKIYGKLGVSSRTEAVAVAVQNGILQLEGQEEVAVPDETENVASEENSVVRGMDNEHETLISEEEQPIVAAIVVENDRLEKSRIWWAILFVSLVVIGGVSYFAREKGGVDVVLPTATPFVEQILDHNKHWRQLESLSNNWSNGLLLNVGVDLYQIGGMNEHGLISQTFRFNSVSQLWQEVPAKPTPLLDSGGAVLFGEIYVVGGTNEQNEVVQIVEAYSPVNGGWRQIASLPEPLMAPFVVSDGSFLYVLGGKNEDGVSDRAYQYDPGGNSWHFLPELPAARFSLVGGIIKGQLYVAGGEDEQGGVTDCWRFDFKEQIWFECQNLATSHLGAGGAVVLNRLYVLGGEQPYGEFYDPNLNEWGVVVLPESGEISHIGYWGVSSIERQIYLMGGKKEGDILNDAYLYVPFPYQYFIPAVPSSGTQQQDN